MSNVARRPFIVHCVPFPEGERYVIIATDTLIGQTFPPRPGEPWWDAMRRFFNEQELLTEHDLRAKLAAIGIAEDEATERIQQARKRSSLNAQFSWDHATSIGFRNREGQVVVRKTGRDGQTPGQRVFIIRCTVCGHEYGCDGWTSTTACARSARTARRGCQRPRSVRLQADTPVRLKPDTTST
jgi:hypothetical protein